MQIGQHLLGMPVSLDVVEDVGNLAVRTDHKCNACDSFHLSSVHILFSDYAEGFADFLVGVGQQCVGQVVFVLEFLLILWLVG